MKRKSVFDDGFQSYLVEGAEFEGFEGIPKLLDLQNAEVPLKLVPFDKARSEKEKHGYIHFYIHDNRYGEVLTNTRKYDDLISQFDGIITPDPTIIIGKSHCLHAVSTYMNRAVGFYEQKRGVPVIVNVRWGDPSTYDVCFLGIPKHSIVAIGTHGSIVKDKATNDMLRKYFKMGLKKMLERLEPADVIVYGSMPEDIFGEFMELTRFHRFQPEIEKAHRKEV